MLRSITLWLCAALCLTSCDDGAPTMQPMQASVADIDGLYRVHVQVNGLSGVASNVVVMLEASPMLTEQLRCPVWDRQAVYLNDTPLTVWRAGGPYVVNELEDGCMMAVFETKVDVHAWSALPTLSIRVADETGAARFVFENFIRTPTVVVESPVSGVVRRGDELVLRFDPSVDALSPGLQISEGPAGTSWANYAMADVAIDHYRARIVVPPNATLGKVELTFYTGAHPAGFGFKAGVIECTQAFSCDARRVSGGGLALPASSLDDAFVRVPVTVVE